MVMEAWAISMAMDGGIWVLRVSFSFFFFFFREIETLPEQQVTASTQNHQP